MVKPSLYLALLFVISFDSVCASAQTLSHRPLTAEQVAIYRAALQEYEGRDSLYLANRTEPFGLEFFEENKGCLQSEGILLNMARRNMFHDLGREVELDPRVVLIDPGKREIVKEIVKKTDPDELFRNLINGQPPVLQDDLNELVGRSAFATEMITFSEIAFNKQHTRAAHCSSLGGCGAGSVMMLKKVRGKWKINDTCPHWIFFVAL